MVEDLFGTKAEPQTVQSAPRAEPRTVQSVPASQMIVSSSIPTEASVSQTTPQTKMVIPDANAPPSERQKDLIITFDVLSDDLVKASLYAGGGILLLLIVYFISKTFNLDLIDIWFFALISPFAAIITYVKNAVSVLKHKKEFVLCGEIASQPLTEEIKKASNRTIIGGIFVPVMVVIFFSIVGNFPAEREYDYIDDVKTRPQIYSGVTAQVGDVMDKYIDSPKWSEKRRTLFDKYIKGEDSSVAYVTVSGKILGEPVSFIYEIDNLVISGNKDSAHTYLRDLKLYRVTYDGRRLTKEVADNFELFLYEAYGSGNRSLEDYLYDNNVDKDDLEAYLFD